MLGQALSHYKVKDRLGAGGMGEVYRVEDTRLGREVALKVLLPEFAGNEEWLRRFRREAQLLAALDHPGIVTIFSVEEAEGVHFLTMQLVEGDTLDRVIPPGGLPPGRFLEIAVGLTDAVAAAHERGVIHRDLKPSNVICTKEGRVKVLDFGLAKLTQTSAPGDDRTGPAQALSRHDIVLGTVPYMSPEQLSAEAVDERTDVFSLGVVLYEMATGQRPFTGTTPAALLSSILTARPPAVSEVRRDVPREIGNLIGRCLEKRPQDRLSTVREVHAKLQQASAVLSGSTSASAGPTAARASGRDTTPSIAILPFTSLSADPEDEFFADGVTEEVINALGRLPDLKVAARTSTFSFKGTTDDLRAIGERLGVGTILEGSVRRSGKRLRITAQLVDAHSGYHLWSERYDRELVDVFDIQEEIARSIASRLTVTLAGSAAGALVHHGTKDVEAFRLYMQARSLLEQRTASETQRAVGYMQRAVERDPGYALAWAGLADTLLILDEYEFVEAGSQIPRIRAAVDRALAIEPDLAEAHASLGLLYSHPMVRQGRAAIEALERAVRLRPSYADAHNWLSWVQIVLGHAAASLQSAQRAVELNPLSPESLSHLALALLACDQGDRAIRHARRATEISPDFGTAAFYEAVVLYHARHLDEAASILQRTSVSWAPMGPACVLALTEVSRGNTDRARGLLDRLTSSGDQASAGLVHAALGEADEAFRAFERVDRWGYWPSIAMLNLFKERLAPLRHDPRFAGVIRNINESWHVVPREPDAAQA